MAVNINVPSQVKTYTDLAAFPASGALKTIYIAEDTNKTYRWTGSVYVEVSAAGASGITIGTTAITSGTVGRVLFEGTGNVVQESANLFWDATNNRLGIGTSSPTTIVDIQPPIGGPVVRVARTGGAEVKISASILSTGGFIGTYTASPFILVSNSAERMRILANGNVLIGTTTDAGYRLDVNGTARIENLTIGDGTYRGTSITFASLAGGAEKKGIFFDGGAKAYYQQTTNLLALESPYNGGVLALSFDGNTNNVNFYNTSGTILSKIFAGTGNWAINTTTDNGYKLDVNGTARVQGKLTLGNSTASPYQLNVWGGAIESYISLNNTNSGNLNTDGFQIGLESNGTDVYFINRENGFIKFRTNNLDRFSIFSTGNVGINTTTDAGYKLDVNGTARVTGNITQSGANTSNLGYIVNTGVLGVASNLPSASSLAMVIGCVSNNGHTATFTKGDNPNSTAIRITDQNVGLSVNHFIVDYRGASGFGIANGTLQVNASAQVEIQSTTKGFLPPRMTTTQKNAIASPATGLQVHDTTLNRPCFYDGTTWITL
jgi:hypothetical protein